MNTNSKSKSIMVFNAVYFTIDKEITFDPSWNDTMEHYGGATTMDLPDNTFAKSHCTVTNRRLIFIGTILGTIVIFERYIDGPVVSSVPEGSIYTLSLTYFPGGRLGEYQLSTIFGVSLRGALLCDEDGPKRIYMSSSNICRRLRMMRLLFKQADISRIE